MLITEKNKKLNINFERHPAAFGFECNVPNKFSKYRGLGLE